MTFPHRLELMEKIQRTKFISTLNLNKCNWQVSLSHDSYEYTAFKILWGLHQYTIFPLRLHRFPTMFL